jgi:predicted unusual protein kinase regulating ubiquinone biosynthesis (AarF/ABC1/UbiB family)
MATPTDEEWGAQAHPPTIDRARYRRVRRFFLRALLHALWWDVVLNRPLLRRLRRPPLERWQGVARRYRELALDLGGVLIKLGQFLSARVDVLPHAITSELATLQDEVPPVSTAAVVRQVEEDLGKPLAELFAHFSATPAGAASLAQAHAARLHTGEDVVVKVLRPGIERLVETDLAAIGPAIRWLRRSATVRRRVDVEWLRREFTAVTRRELDLENEGKNAERFGADFADDASALVPKVYWSHTRGRVLTLENVAAIKVTNLEALEAAGVDRREVARRLYAIYMQQFFITHFVHADPHPGNIFIHPLTPSPGPAGSVDTTPEDSTPFRVAFVDFGMMTEIPERLRLGLREFAIGLGTRDARRIVDAYVTAGTLLPNADLDRLVEAHEAILSRFWGVRLSELRDVAMHEARHLAMEYRDLLFELPIQVQADMLFAMRAVGILAGLCTTLDDRFDPWAETIPFAERLTREAERHGVSGVLDELGELAQALLKAPAQLDRLLGHLDRGNLTIRTSPSEEATRRLERLERSIDRLAWLVGGGTMLVSATLLRSLTDQRVAAAVLLGGAVFAFLLGLLRRR